MKNEVTSPEKKSPELLQESVKPFSESKEEEKPIKNLEETLSSFKNYAEDRVKKTLNILQSLSKQWRVNFEKNFIKRNEDLRIFEEQKKRREEAYIEWNQRVKKLVNDSLFGIPQSFHRWIFEFKLKKLIEALKTNKEEKNKK